MQIYLMQFLSEFFYNLNFDGRGGVNSAFKNTFSHTFSGVYRGHKVRGHPCKLGNLAIFYHAKKIQKIYLFYCLHK